MHKPKLMIFGTLVAAVAVACGGGATASPSTAPSTAPATEAPSAEPSTAGKPLFVAIYKSADQGYFIDQAAGFKAKIEELGGEAKTFDTKLDPNLAITLINDAISAGAKGIGITVPDQTMGPAVAKLAADAKIPLIATDDNISDESGTAVPFAGFNGKDMGAKVGAAAADLLAKSGWDKTAVGVLSVEVQTLSVCNDRTDNQKQAMLDAGVPAANIIPVPYTGEVQSAQDAAGPLITANPSFKQWVIFGCNDQGVQGTINALETAGFKPADMIGVGLGTDLACKPWAKNAESGFKASLFLYGGDVGAAAAEALWNAAMNNTPLPEATVAKTTIVDPTNYKYFVPQAFGDACGQLARPALVGSGFAGTPRFMIGRIDG